MSGCHAGWGTSPRHGSRWGAASDDPWGGSGGGSGSGSWSGSWGDRTDGTAEPRRGAAVDDRVRIGDAERDAALAALGEHYALGRLTSVEHDERTRVALEARTAADLAAVFVDLPRSPAASPGDGADAGWSGARSGRHSFARRRRHSRRGPQVPWLPVVGLVVVGLVVLSALTHAPWILLGVALWFLLRGPRHGWAHPRHGGHGGHGGPRVRPAGAGAPSRG